MPSTIMKLACNYLEERDLVFEFGVRGVGGAGHQREMIEQAPGTQILRRLRNDLAALHGLAIPKGRSILVRVSEESHSSNDIHLQ